jgi:hypothetical protein
VFKAYDNFLENKKKKKLQKIEYEKREKEKKIKEEIKLNLEIKNR